MDGSTASSSSALYVPAPLPPAEVLPSVALNGAADLLPRFGLLPLYERAVRPYLPRRRAPPGADGASAQQAHADDAAGDETLPLDGDERRADGEPPVRLLPKTYAHYVEDLPGACSVRPGEVVCPAGAAARPALTPRSQARCARQSRSARSARRRRARRCATSSSGPRRRCSASCLSTTRRCAPPLPCAPATCPRSTPRCSRPMPRTRATGAGRR
jgi:hypothetical protein